MNIKGEYYDGIVGKPSLDEALEHYGVKGMKWHFSKAKGKAKTGRLRKYKHQYRKYYVDLSGERDGSYFQADPKRAGDEKERTSFNHKYKRQAIANTGMINALNNHPGAIKVSHEPATAVGKENPRTEERLKEAYSKRKKKR